jgi:uncharacterized protein (TIGR03435 family)
VSHYSPLNFSLARKFQRMCTGIAPIAACLVIGLSSPALLHAQSEGSDWEKAAGGKMAFEVASVKQNVSSGEPGFSNLNMGSGDAFFTPTGGLVSIRNVFLITDIAFAYKLSSDQAAHVKAQLPTWAHSDRFDIEARAVGNPTKDQFRLMMQALLADRFKLALHFETRETPVFALVVDKRGKLGPQLRPHLDDPPCGDTTTPLGPPVTVSGGFPETCGQVLHLRARAPGLPNGEGARNMTIAAITTALTGLANLDRPLVDETGLTGKFDFLIEFSNAMPVGAASGQDALSFVGALKDQLGLKLEPTTSPMETVEVDHIEEPSPN